MTTVLKKNNNINTSKNDRKNHYTIGSVLYNIAYPFICFFKFIYDKCTGASNKQDGNSVNNIQKKNSTAESSAQDHSQSQNTNNIQKNQVEYSQDGDSENNIQQNYSTKENLDQNTKFSQDSDSENNNSFQEKAKRFKETSVFDYRFDHGGISQAREQVIEDTRNSKLDPKKGQGIGLCY